MPLAGLGSAQIFFLWVRPLPLEYVVITGLRSLSTSGNLVAIKTSTARRTSREKSTKYMTENINS